MHRTKMSQLRTNAVVLYILCCMNGVYFSLLMHVWENWKRKLDSAFQLQTARLAQYQHLLCGRQVLSDSLSVEKISEILELCPSMPWCCWLYKLKFHGNDTDTDFLADFRETILMQPACRGARGPFSSPTKSADFCRRALFLARMSVGNARVYTFTCTVHDKLSCTHLQNYTIGASLKSVSVPCKLSYMQPARNFIKH